MTVLAKLVTLWVLLKDAWFRPDECEHLHLSFFAELATDVITNQHVFESLVVLFTDLIGVVALGTEQLILKLGQVIDICFDFTGCFGDLSHLDQLLAAGSAEGMLAWQHSKVKSFL